MVILRKIIIILVFGICFSSCQKSGVEKFSLDANWKFKQTSSNDWLSANVPGCVHLDLLHHEKIKDPFFGNNEEKLQWIGETDWEYKTVFNGEDVLNNDRVDLVFEGLDTYADVYLNDSLILTVDNMFRTWELDVSYLVNPGKNELYIRFNAPGKIEKEKATQVGYKLPEARGFTRKAPYQYGWDWGPTFITSGIWRQAFLRTWNNARIKDVQHIQNTLSQELAKYTAVCEIESTRDQKGNFQLKTDGKILAERPLILNKGINMVNLPFEIENPEIWWPNGLGEQPLYEIECVLNTRSSNDTYTSKIGIRDIELVKEKDQIGESFYFRVNGEPVFMKGANYIPQDNFPSRVTDEKYRQTLQTAIDANMNMLRVWGGGIYEKDIFYELCDEMGILVWQDFMFACNMYPGDKAFVDNVKQEAIQNVMRLRNHPCIAIWCGNNEVDEGWFNWGWQKSLGYSESDSLEVWNNYVKVFEELLPEVIDQYDHQRPYWPSSPKKGWGHEQALYFGDMHYWGVWWGEEPFEVYEKKVGRFMTEYGFQGIPDVKTLQASLNDGDLKLESENLLNHQKHPRGMELIQMYMERDFNVPQKFEHYAYVSQLVQAYGIKTALEAHRRAKPNCMGTLYWQLNDCWPVISWSSVDYNNRWKALHYFTRDIFEDYLISFEEKDESLSVFVVSDKLEESEGKLELKLGDFEGHVTWKESNEIEIPANSSQIYFTRAFGGFDKSSYLLNVRLTIDGTEVAEDNHYFLPIKDLQLPAPKIEKELVRTKEGYLIKLSTDKLAKNVYLSAPEEGFYTDNCMDILPGETALIEFLTKDPVPDFANGLKILTLADTY